MFSIAVIRIIICLCVARVKVLRINFLQITYPQAKQLLTFLGEQVYQQKINHYHTFASLSFYDYL